MTVEQDGRREALAQLLAKAKRELLAEWQSHRTSDVPATRRLGCQDLRREDSELFDLIVDAVRTASSGGLARFATTVIERRFQHQFMAEEILAEATLLRRLCEERIPAGPERAELLCLLAQVFDSHVQELFRVAMEFLVLRVDQRTSQLERFYSFSEVILNTMQDGVIVMDLHGRIIKANHSAQVLLGYTENDILGLMPPYPFCEPWQDDCCRSFVEDCLREGRAFHDPDTVFLTRGGEKLPFHVHAVPMRNHAEEVTGALVVFRDVRETKELVAELREAKISLEERVFERTRQIEDERARLERILRNLFDMVIIVNADGAILEANEAAGRAMAMDPSRLVGLPFREIAVGGEESGIEAARRRCQTGGERVPDVQGSLIDASFRPFAVAMNFAPLRDSETTVQGVVCVARDIRQRLALETRQSVTGNINRILAGTLDVRSQFERIAEELRRLFDFDRMSITVEVPGSEDLEVYSLAGSRPEHKRGPAGRLPRASSIVGAVLDQKRIVRVPDIALSDYFEASFLVPNGIRSAMSLPLVEHDRVFGSLNFGSARTNDFESLPEDFLHEIAAQIAVAVANSRIHSGTAYAAALHAAVLAAMQDPVFVTDLKGCILFANAAAASFSGYAVEEIVGRSWVDVTRPLDLDSASRVHEEILSTGAVVRRQITGRHRDGHLMTVEFSSGLVRDLDGRPLQIITVMRQVAGDAASGAEERAAA